MEIIKQKIQEHRKLCIGLAVLVVIALLGVLVKLICYRISDFDYDFPYADLGDFCLMIAYFIGFFLAILLVGFIFGLIASALGSKIHLCWYIVITNSLVVAFGIYTIIDDWFISPGWLQGLATALICGFVFPVNIAVYIFCTFHIHKFHKKLQQESNGGTT